MKAKITESIKFLLKEFNRLSKKNKYKNITKEEEETLKKINNFLNFKK